MYLEALNNITAGSKRLVLMSILIRHIASTLKKTIYNIKIKYK